MIENAPRQTHRPGTPAAPVPQRSIGDLVLPHLDQAYRLARWRVQREEDAQAVVLESVRLAVGHMATLPAGRSRAWFLRIVSRTCDGLSAGVCTTADGAVATVLEGNIASLPNRLREALVLRDLEGLPYDEVAEVMDVSVTAAMTGVSRARRALAGVSFEPLTTVEERQPVSNRGGYGADGDMR